MIHSLILKIRLCVGVFCSIFSSRIERAILDVLASFVGDEYYWTKAKLFYIFNIFLTIQMKSFEKLMTNTTNRLSVTNNNALPIITSRPLIVPSPIRAVPTASKISSQQLAFCLEFSALQQQEIHLMSQISEAKIEQEMMLNLFTQILKVQKGEVEHEKKRHRRCADEILIKFECPIKTCRKNYSSQTSLARHVKLKHTCIKVEPPQPYDELHPNPNLIQLLSEGSEEEPGENDTKSGNISVNSSEQIQEESES